MGARARPPDMRCVHCSATETPLWRAGPAGPKTLCNACGVRWKKTGSVIPRAKRTSPSSAAAPVPAAVPHRPPAPDHPAPAQPAVRKRARVATPPPTPAPANSAPRPLTPPFHPLPPASPPDPRAAAVAAAVTAIPAPKPVSVFRVSDAGRSKYESVFSGLMAVHRPPKNSEDKKTPNGDDPSSQPRGRTRTQTHRASAFFAEFAPPQRPPPLDLPNSPTAPLATAGPPCPSPPPVERPQQEDTGDGVYVTEVHAPSPSPSPPPLPRVQRQAEGGGFTLMMAVAPRKDPL